MAPLTDDERWFWHGYDYGFRRVVWNDFERKSSIDQDGDWFDERLANVAEGFYRRKFNAPPPPGRRPDPTTDDIAYVETVCNQARANIEKWAAANAAAFRPKRKPLADIQRDLGMSAMQEAAE